MQYLAMSSRSSKIHKENAIREIFNNEMSRVLGLPPRLPFRISGSETSMLSRPSDSNQMMECIPMLLQQGQKRMPMHVLDAFASAGGNTMYFMCTMPAGSVIDAVQIANSDEERTRVQNLEYNVDLCRRYISLQTTVNVFAQPIEDYITSGMHDGRPTIDLLFADPPWRLDSRNDKDSDSKDIMEFMHQHMFFDESFCPRYIIFKMPSRVPLGLFESMLNVIGKRKYVRAKEVGIMRRGQVRYWAYGYALESTDQQCYECGKMKMFRHPIP
jgi:hypothetical protein